MAKKKKSIGQLKKDLWSLISQCVRLGAADSNGYVKCVTCETRKHWKEMQAGHYVPQAQGNAAKFDRRNSHPQCYRCNMNLGGNGPEYTPYMVNRYGKAVVEEIRQLAGKTVKYTRADLEEMIEATKQELEQIQQGDRSPGMEHAYIARYS